MSEEDVDQTSICTILLAGFAEGQNGAIACAHNRGNLVALVRLVNICGFDTVSARAPKIGLGDLRLV